MQVLQAGQHKFILLELDPEIVTSVAKQTGFEARVLDGPRHLSLDLVAQERQSPLLLFDASDPANAGWFSRCQFYVDGRTGAVMQTPLSMGNKQDRAGKPEGLAIRVTVSKELPVSFRMPGKQAITEQVVYALLYNFLSALTKTGVAVCGGTGVKPLVGRTES
jgi:hypothetical protein